MKIVTFDLSLTAPGCCVDGAADTFKVPSDSRGMGRIHLIQQWAMGLSWDADLVGIEGYSFGSKGAAVVNIGELGGVIRYALWREGVEYVDIPPSCLKKFATGRGDAPKDHVLQAGVMKSGHVFADHNACDAWWLWVMTVTHYEPDDARLPSVPKLNLTALEKVEWPVLEEG